MRRSFGVIRSSRGRDNSTERNRNNLAYCIEEIRCPSARFAQAKYVPVVFNTLTRREHKPNATETAICEPSPNICDAPTDKNPVIDEIAMTGKSIHVRRVAYTSSARLCIHERQFAFSPVDAKWSSSWVVQLTSVENSLIC